MITFANLKIGVRLKLLAGFFLLAVLLTSLTGWTALREMNDHNAAGLAEATMLTEAVDTARSAQVAFKIQVQEWKNILLRGQDPAQLAKYTKAFGASGETTRRDLEKLKGLTATLRLPGDMAGMVDGALAAHADLERKYRDALRSHDAADGASAHRVDLLVKGMDRAPTERINRIVEAIGREAAARGAAIREHNAAAYTRSAALLGILLVLTVAIGAVIVTMLVRGITLPLAHALAVAREVADGDLRSDTHSTRGDEIGELLRALSTMSGNLSRIVAQVRAGTQTIATASAEIAHGNADLSARTESQAGSLEQTASSMTELTSTVKQNSDNAGTAVHLAEQASEKSARGSATVAEVVASMDTINGTSARIGEIIGVIDGLAFQTNILALNAAVEAARAGEQGRGFAVVASEVRALAQRSAVAAKEIRDLITTSLAEVASGRALAGRAGDTMHEVLESTRQVATMVRDIASASGEQQQGIEQIGQAISHIDGATQQNAALVEQAAAAAGALRDQALQLDDSVAVFRLRAAQARLAHA